MIYVECILGGMYMGINKKELYIEMGTRIRQARRAHDYTVSVKSLALTKC